MATFWELFKESVVIRGTLAVMYSAVVLWMYASGRTVPDTLVAMLGVVLAWFSNAVTTSTANRAADKALDKFRRGG